MRIGRIILLMLIAALVAPAAGAGDDMQAVSSLWNDFVAALRRGDYRGAHAMFSPQSRAALPLDEFAREYGPFSAAREMMLAKPDSLSTRLADDWAEISYSGNGLATGRGFRVGIAVVRNEGVWGLVAARNEPAERAEAEARGVLQAAATWRGAADAPQQLAEFVAVSTRANPLLAHYRFETDGRAFRALPQNRDLRAFHLDAWGMARPGERPGAAGRLPAMPAWQAAAPAGTPSTAPATPPALSIPADGLPELREPPGPAGALPEPREPPPASFAPAPLGELAEPPAFDFPAIPGHDKTPAGFTVAEPEAVTLPDVIR